MWEAFEENARSEVSDFQTGQITGLSDRRPHLKRKLQKLIIVLGKNLRADMGLPANVNGCIAELQRRMLCLHDESEPPSQPV
ncbi:MAG: hypothetical protein NTV93_12225 [Verrucomicrobia bacterium]|nr:hypothetical protein [Verrucomicrobiota bacterium]